MALHIVKADGSGDFTTHALAIAAAFSLRRGVDRCP